MPHRKRINEIFEDGDKCYLYLKDRHRKNTNEMFDDWYEQAYGAKRNTMKFTMKLDVPENVKFTATLLYFAEVTYQMFPEHIKEFAHSNFDPVMEVALEEDEYAQNSYYKEMDLPFGTVSAVLKYREEGSEEQKLQDPPS